MYKCVTLESLMELKPGYVIYEGQKTLYVTPDKTLVEKMHQ